MATLIGVFDNDSDLEVALNALYNQDVKDVRVWDNQRKNDTPGIPLGGLVAAAGLGQANSGSNGGSANGYSYVAPLAIAAADITPDHVISTLGDPSITGEEADFYADAVRNGGRLIIVNVDDDKAGAIRQIFYKSNASNFTRTQPK
jgi:hypothetical protein